MYKLTNNGVIRLSDNAYIPLDPANTDYQTFLVWQSTGNEPEPVDSPSLEQLSAAIDKERDQRLSAGVDWDGRHWYSDEVFQGQVTARISAWNAGIIAPDATKDVRAMDGSIYQLTFDQHKALAVALMSYVESVYGWSWIEKAKL